MLLMGLVLLAWLGVHYPDAPTIGPVIGGLLLAVAIVVYNLHHKGNPLSPVVMGICRVMVYITGALCFALPSAPVFIAAGALLAYLIGLTYVAKQENFGSVENLWPVALLAVPLIVGAVAIGAEPVSGFFWVALLLWIGVALWLIRRRAPGDIPRAVVSLIAGISLVDAVLIAGLGEIQFALVAVCGFVLTLFLQRYIAGT